MHLARLPSLGLVARTLTVAVATVVAVACGSDNTAAPLAPAAMSRVSPDSQATAAGVAMAQPLVVLVNGGNGAPLAGTPVVWTIESGGGTLSDTTSATDAEGHASTVYTPGTAVGTAKVSAQAGSITGVLFTITLTPGEPAALKKFGFENPAVVKGSKLTLSVKVVDKFGNGIPGATVAWTTTGGTTSGATSTTDSGGVAAIDYTIGAAAGAYALTATVSGLTPVTFPITAI